VNGRDGRPERWRIDDVLARVDLAALLDELAEPATHNVRGRRWHCPVPDHDDHHASVTMHTDHRGHERWRCWSGDSTHRGDAVDLVAVTQRLDRTEAVAWLAHRAGIVAGHDTPPLRRKPRPSVPRIVPLDPAVMRYALACERILWGPTGAPVRDWLHRRGFDDNLLRLNHVGADPGRRMMRRQRGLPHGTSIAAVLPALDPDGNIRYVQTRYLEPGDGPKYDNPAAALGSNPRLAWTRRPATTAGDVLIVCEGIPDALTAAQAGFPSVGILGSQAPDDTVAARLATHVQTHHSRLVAIADNDAAGAEWAKRLRRLLHSDCLDIVVTSPPAEVTDLNAWSTADPRWSARVSALRPRESPSLPMDRNDRTAEKWRSLDMNDTPLAT
jgi:hypothetical protein